MQMIPVYRFEDANGCGPFDRWRGAGLYDEAQQHSEYHSCADMPSLNCTQERGSDAHQHARLHGCLGLHFGFTTLDQLKEAFPCPEGRVNMAMAKGDFRIAVYEVPPQSLLTGYSQCLFKKEHAVLVGYCDLRSLEFTRIEG